MNHLVRRAALAIAATLLLAAPAAHAAVDLVPFTNATWPAPLALSHGSDPLGSPLREDSLVAVVMGVFNNGSTNSGPMALGFYSDSLPAYTSGLFSVTAAHSSLATTGPVLSMRGGLHTNVLKVDFGDNVVESDETNNFYGMQTSVIALGVISPNILTIEPAPPKPFVMSGFVPAPSYANKAGYKYLPPSVGQGAWSVIALTPPFNGDYDLGVYNPATSQSSGFRTPVLASTIGPDITDMIVYNFDQNSRSLALDIGVTATSGTGSFGLEHRAAGDNTPMTANTTVTHAFVQNQMVGVEEFNYVPDAAKPHTVFVVTAPAGSNLQITVLTPSIAKTTRAAFPNGVHANAQGVASMTLDLGSVAGKYGILVYRDVDGGHAPVSYDLSIVTKADLTVDPIPGNNLAINAANGTPDLLTDPFSISAGSNTFAKFGYWNDGANLADVGTYHHQFLVDGVTVADQSGVRLNSLQSATYTQDLGLLSGGRHTIGMRLDPSNTLDEFYETNNRMARQFTVLAADLLGIDTRPAPPDGQGGWADLPGSVTPLENLDAVTGQFFVSSTNEFGATFMTPSAGCDYDLRWYAHGTSLANGFQTQLGSVHKAAGRTVGLLGDFQANTRVDMAVRRYSGSGAYTIQMVRGVDLGNLPIASGPLTIPAGEIGQLYILHDNHPSTLLSLQLLLNNLSGNADLGVAVYPHTSGVYGSFDMESVAAANLNGAGGNEECRFAFTESVPNVRIAVLVYKLSAAELPKAASFQLFTNAIGTTGVGDPAPAHLAFAIDGENPVRSHTTLRFDLPQAADAVLELYDVSGQRVRTLATGVHAAGTYRLEWTGDGDDGRTLGAGLYFARFRSGGFVRTARLTVIR